MYRSIRDSDRKIGRDRRWTGCCATYSVSAEESQLRDRGAVARKKRKYYKWKTRVRSRAIRLD